MVGPQPKINYQHNGTYDRQVFIREFAAQFGRHPRYDAGAMPDMLVLLGYIERDTGINDIRHAAYMLATVMWETSSPIQVEEVVRNRKGQLLLDRHRRAVVLSRRKWRMTMAPVSEVGQGKGRKYHEPVKVKLLPDGSARITEQDGDQFGITRDGIIRPLTGAARIGSPYGRPASKVYEDDDGVEQAYYGRGYVQLTWWSNYAAAGMAIGRGLELLLDPELVKQPELSYALMSHGMRTGQGFANGHRFDQFFVGPRARYREARQMVNGDDHAEEVAALARRFEAVLLAAARAPVVSMRRELVHQP